MSPPAFSMKYAAVAALLDRHRALVDLPHAVAEHEEPVAREERDIGVAHGLHRDGRVVDVVDAAGVLVDQHELAATERGALVVAARDPAQVRVDGRPVRMVVHRETDAGAQPVQREVEGDTRCRGPVAVEHVAVEVDADDVVGAELVP